MIYPNSIPYRALPEGNKSDSVVFSGNMRYRPNQSAVRYFYHSVWPLVRERWPGFVWKLVGRDPECLPAGILQDKSVDVVGAVDDAVVALSSARVAVAPLLAGSGTRLKIIEAWAAGVPVVSTSLGAEGLSADPGEHLLLADSPKEFAQAISALLSSEELCNRLAANARQLYEQSLNWVAAWRHLEAAGL